MAVRYREGDRVGAEHTRGAARGCDPRRGVRDTKGDQSGLGELFGEVAERCTGVAVLDCVADHTVGPSRVKGGVEADTECRLRETEASIDPHRPRSIVVDNGVDITREAT